jgi:CSLREA domain-containing protein
MKKATVTQRLAPLRVLGKWTLLAGALALSTPPARASTYVVNSTVDAVDATPGDDSCATAAGVCTLRAAVQEANAHAGFDSIRIPIVGTIRLSLAGAGEDAAATGDLDLTDAAGVDISGDGRLTTIVDANKIDRVFHILSGVATISSIAIRKGSVQGPGGGVYAEGGELSLDTVAVELNTGFQGGGIHCAAIDECAILGSVISKNNGLDEGGGIYSESVDFTIESSSVQFNKGQRGGGLYLSGEDNAVGYSAIAFNSVVPGEEGGGIFVQSGGFEIYSTSLTNNRASVGGGLADYSFEPGNRLTGVTVARNLAVPAGEGGGILANGGFALTLRNCTLSGNTAATGGAIRNAGNTSLYNTIVHGSNNCDATVGSSTHSLDSGTTCGLSGIGDLTMTDPKLAPLQVFPDGAAPSIPKVLPLKFGSPAVDAGDNAVAGAEGRAYPRVRDGNGDGVATVDIGAYEVQ